MAWGFLKQVWEVSKGFLPGYNEMKNRELAHSKLELDKYQFEQTRENRIKQQEDYFKKQAQLAANEYFVDNAWPLLMPPEFMAMKKNAHGDIVMRVIFAESNDPEYQKLIGDSVKNRLHSIMTEIFSEFSTHPINFYFDGWKKGHNGGTPSLDALYQIMKGQPTLVIMPIISDQGETLLIRTAFWGIGTESENPMSLDFLKIPLGRIKRDVSREFAKQWRDFKRRIDNHVKNTVNPIDEKNLKLLSEEETFITEKISLDEIEKRTCIHYKYDITDKRLSQDVVDYLVAAIEATISYISDIYYLIEYDRPMITPFVLSNLKHPSYLPSIAQQILPLYEASRNLIQTNDTKVTFLNINQYSLDILREKIVYLMNYNGCVPKNPVITADCFAQRLIWDERLSELLKTWLGRTVSNEEIKNIADYVMKLLRELDRNIWQDGVLHFVEALSEDQNKESIIFAIISRHTLIREFKTFIQLAAYRIYVDLKIEQEGINWLISFRIANTIANLSEDSDKPTTPSLIIEKDKETLSLIITDVLKNLSIKADESKIDELIADGLLMENIRKIADLFLEFNKYDKEYMKLIN